jgi:hypothetical protein
MVGGHFILYSDTSRKHVGSSLWQMQNGKPKLIGYASKTLHDACKNYSVTELEMQGLVNCIDLWIHILHHVEFDCAVDHQAAVQIMKSKNKPATARITRLLEQLSNHAFNLYYVKEKDMILSDFFSRTPCDNGHPYDLTPISFSAQDTIDDYYFYYADSSDTHEHYNIQTRSEAAAEQAPTIHGADKILNPHLKTEQQKFEPKVLPPLPTPDVRPKIIAKKLVQKSIQHLQKKLQNPKGLTPRYQPPSTANVMPSVPSTPEINTPVPMNDYDKYQQPHSTPLSRSRPNMFTPTMFTPQKQTQQIPAVPCQHDSPYTSPLQAQPKQTIPFPTGPLVIKQQEFIEDPDLDLNDPANETLVDPVYYTPKAKDFCVPPSLAEAIGEEGHIIHNFLPKQHDIDALLKNIKQKVLREAHFPDSVKDIQAAYLNSPHFKDIYLYLTQNKTPDSKKSQ